ncbi:hypothetical protein [Mucilaginibacter sp. SP1R1]|uniref:hypothetical protein n=1 Tax=Mucilaginibacter sp. SP1R1 TaxID=2723091 RepID=UPI0017A995B2|nr:hypothetical protein [Mucilaginibacter sp. SP1R1]MBB6151838.1 hypothetical protein [Mucilaginibacter sp. SP1R1]
MKKLFLVFFLALFVLTKRSNAQGEPFTGPILNQKSLHFNAGTQGLGAEFSYGVLSRAALRLGVNFIPVAANNPFEISGFNSTSKLTASFSNIHLLADFTPFENASGFRLVGGAAYFMNANGNLQVQPTDKYTYGDIVLSPNDVGKLNMNVNWKGVAPYLGIGLLKAFPNHAFNVNLDLGSYYLRQPAARISGTGILESNSSQTGQFQQNIKGYRFLPVVQVNFNFKI